MRALLDVNVLIALLDAAHVHHRIARDWLHEHIAEGWASCPLTQNACLRIMAQANYPGAQVPALIATRLAAACQTQWHEFWPDSISLLESGLLDCTIWGQSKNSGCPNLTRNPVRFCSDPEFTRWHPCRKY